MGKVITLAADGTYTSEVKDGIIEKTIAGVMAPFGGEDKAVTSDISLWGMVATNVANTIATSLYTRSQVAKGAEPALGVLF